jgi:6-phosphogluconolactonase
MKTAGPGPRELVIVRDAAAVARVAAERVAAAAHEAVRAQRRFALALAGGSTPRAAYELLGARTDIDWAHVDLFWGDERAVPFDHPDSNYQMACESLLAHAAVLAARVYRMPVDSHDLDAAAHDYDATLRRVLGTPPCFDVVLLGLGEDGHTASLFSGQSAIDEEERYVVATAAPRIAPRLTLTRPVLRAARTLLFLVAGAAKKVPLAQILDGTDAMTTPAARVAREAARVTWIVDRAARGTTA